METNILVKTDNLTNEEWLRWRQKGLGGSDMETSYYRKTG